MTQAVRETILAPMLELYLPPKHLRHDAEARTRAPTAYEQALGAFDRDTLQKGWQRILAEHTFWSWPDPGTISAACRACAPRKQAGGEEEQKRGRALDMADAYTARYMRTSQLARLARDEGWGQQLREYVAAAAWVQAQLICGVRNIGWSTALFPGNGRLVSSQEGFDAYRQTAGKAIERGSIRVTVPQGCIRLWKEKAQFQPERTAG